jgi:hypothetical protein
VSESEARMEQENIRLDELYNACLTRPLTDEEMAKVLRMGYNLCVRYGVSFNRHEKTLEFHSLMVSQIQIQLAFRAASGAEVE